jgi:hypothetical protein
MIKLRKEKKRNKKRNKKMKNLNRYILPQHNFPGPQKQN